MFTDLPGVDPAQRYISFKQFYEAAGLGRTKALDEIASGRLPARQCGRKILIDRADMDAWFASLPRAKGLKR
jgi:excisionase family DNA binding protein